MEVDKKKSTKILLSEVLHSIKWGYISIQYFGKSRSWFSQKLNGYDGNRAENDFDDQERNILKKALFDISDKIRKTAEQL